MGTVIGFLLMVTGFILFVGNVSGWWTTFPYAGFITMCLGTLIARLSRE